MVEDVFGYWWSRAMEVAQTGDRSAWVRLLVEEGRRMLSALVGIVLEIWQ